MPESPVRHGFSTLWREPTLALAEIAWRWSWGAATLLIAWFSSRTFLHSLHVSGGDEFRLRSGNPQWIAEAIVHIFGGSGPTLLRIAEIITPAALLLWIIAASLGRAATLHALLGNGRRFLPRTFFLHTWRVVVGVLTFVGIVASYVLGAVLAYRTEPPQPIWLLVIFFPMAVLFTIVRSRINWFLLLANIYAALDRKGGEGFGEATRIFKRRSSDFMGVGTIVGVIRLFLIVVVTVLSFAILAAAGGLPGKLLWAAFVLLTLLYFAVSDWLYMVKLAAYTRIIAEDSLQPAGPRVSAAAPLPAAQPVRS